MSKILSDADLFELTGYKQRSKQAKTLASWGIQFVMNARVLSVTWEQVNNAGKAANDDVSIGINWEAVQ